MKRKRRVLFSTGAGRTEIETVSDEDGGVAQLCLQCDNEKGWQCTHVLSEEEFVDMYEAMGRYIERGFKP